jgi:hypothetical protein
MSNNTYDDGLSRRDDHAARDQGYAAYHVHGDLEQNPYPYGSSVWQNWLEGFYQAGSDSA